MIIMPANVTGPWIRAVDAVFPGHLGNILSPGHWRGRPRPYYALDNGCFSQHGRWTTAAFLTHADKAVNEATKWGNPPRWIAVPDVVGDFSGTLRRWERWAEKLRRRYDWPVALVWQEGATPRLVKRHTDAEVQFIGGKEADWKLDTMVEARRHFPWVHVGRINGVDPALACWEAGVRSIDGTGWMRTDRQRKGLIAVLRMMSSHTKHRYHPCSPCQERMS